MHIQYVGIKQYIKCNSPPYMTAQHMHYFISYKVRNTQHLCYPRPTYTNIYIIILLKIIISFLYCNISTHMEDLIYIHIYIIDVYILKYKLILIARQNAPTLSPHI